MRRDPEAIAAYREILRERGVDESKMSDELVVETIERTVEGILRAGRAMARAIEELREPMMRAAAAMGRLYSAVGGSQLVAETEMDLRLRDELDVDVGLLELFDDGP